MGLNMNTLTADRWGFSFIRYDGEKLKFLWL